MTTNPNDTIGYHNIDAKHLTQWQLSSLCDLLLKQYTATGCRVHSDARDALLANGTANVYVVFYTTFSNDVSAILNSER